MLDASYPQRFGFREFWIDGRDFYLNGSRIYLSAVPFDNAQVSAAAATYEGAKETMLRMKNFGINFVYTHNYGCEPGTHLGFTEILEGRRRRGDAGGVSPSRTSGSTSGRRPMPTRRTATPAMRRSTCESPEATRPW